MNNEWLKEIPFEQYLAEIKQGYLFAKEVGQDICLYMHNPFCANHCLYCIYSNASLRKQDYTDFYTKDIIKQMDLIFSNLPHIKFDKLYMGGGTPSLLKPSLYKNISTFIPKYKEIPFKATEINPSFVSNDFIKMLKEENFNYVSLGVQTFSNEVCTFNERKYTPLEKVKAIVDKLQTYDIYTNLDLLTYIYNFNNQDLDLLKTDLHYVLQKIQPDSITVYQNYHYLDSLCDEDIKEKAMEHTLATIKDVLCQFLSYKLLDELTNDAYTDFGIYKKSKDMPSLYNSSFYKQYQNTNSQFVISIGANIYDFIYSYSGMGAYQLKYDKQKERLSVYKDYSYQPSKVKEELNNV